MDLDSFALVETKRVLAVPTPAIEAAVDGGH